MLNIECYIIHRQQFKVITLTVQGMGEEGMIVVRINKENIMVYVMVKLA